MIVLMKIGVLTYHRAHNYGAYLQAFSLTSYLRSLGYNAELINYDMQKAKDVYKPKNDSNYEQNMVKYNMFQDSLKLLPLSDFSMVDDNIDTICDKINDTYDVVIVGSDEVWKTGGFRGFPNPYWLPKKISSKKIGYAISSRSDFSKLNEEDIKKLKEYINDFDYIGLRDDLSIAQVSKYCTDPSKIGLNCDPTFLYDFKASSENGKKILKEKYNIDTNKKIISLMTNNKILVKLVCKVFGKKANILSIFYEHEGTIGTLALNPFEILDVIKCSDVLLTSFFHGACFAIQNNTNFVADNFRDKSKEQSKIYDLLKRVNMLDNFVSKHDPFYIIKMISKCKKLLNKDKPNYEKVVQEQRKISKTFFDYIKVVSEELDGNE